MPVHWIGILGVIVGSIGCGVLGGGTALAGYLLGVGATAFNLIALWLVIRLLGAPPEEGPKRVLSTGWVVVAFFAKLPLFVLLGQQAHRLGGAAPGCFLAGIALVYSLLVGWALQPRNTS